MITTCRYPSKETREKAKEIAGKHKEKYISRGKHTIETLVEMARKRGDKQIKIVKETSKKPKTIAIIKINENQDWTWSKTMDIGEA